MKFLNSDYSKGYANFAAAGYYAKKKAAAETANSSAVRERAMARQGRVASSGTNSFGPQPMQGPQQKKGKIGQGLTSAKNAAAGKAQYLGAKTKNTLAKAGSFIAKNKVGVGLAAAGALGAGIGATALARKMRNKKKK